MCGWCAWSPTRRRFSGGLALKNPQRIVNTPLPTSADFRTLIEEHVGVPLSSHSRYIGRPAVGGWYAQHNAAGDVSVDDRGIERQERLVDVVAIPVRRPTPLM
ncbi:hypothetical protein GCM10020216_032020 [Nonomuraea helvata]